MELPRRAAHELLLREPRRAALRTRTGRGFAGLVLPVVIEARRYRLPALRSRRLRRVCLQGPLQRSAAGVVSRRSAVGQLPVDLDGELGVRLARRGPERRWPRRHALRELRRVWLRRGFDRVAQRWGTRLSRKPRMGAAEQPLPVRTRRYLFERHRRAAGRRERRRPRRRGAGESRWEPNDLAQRRRRR